MLEVLKEVPAETMVILVALFVVLSGGFGISYMVSTVDNTNNDNKAEQSAQPLVGVQITEIRQKMCFLPVQIGYWHDADTPKQVTVFCPMNVSTFHKDGLRAVNYDSWELTSRNGTTVTDEERKKGAKARDAIIELCKTGKVYIGVEIPTKEDSFGRPLVEFWLERPDGSFLEIAQWAKDNGHVRQ
jgi:hypothetical protein